MKNLTLLILIFVGLVSRGQSTINITSNTTIPAVVNSTDEYIISDNVELTINGAFHNGGKITLMGCGSKLKIISTFTGKYNNIDIERYCDDCSNINNLTYNSGVYSNDYLTINSNISWLDVACMTPLPVELLSMSIDCKAKTINWSTAVEINNNYFTVEYSTDAVNWESRGAITGQGNSSKIVKYSNPITQNGYYRITQTDFDGTTTKFNILQCNSILNNNVTLVGTYDLLGQKINNNTRGLVIELYSNGTSKTILK